MALLEDEFKEFVSIEMRPVQSRSKIAYKQSSLTLTNNSSHPENTLITVLDNVPIQHNTTQQLLKPDFVLQPPKSGFNTVRLE